VVGDHAGKEFQQFPIQGKKRGSGKETALRGGSARFPEKRNQTKRRKAAGKAGFLQKKKAEGGAKALTKRRLRKYKYGDKEPYESPPGGPYEIVGQE